MQPAAQQTLYLLPVLLGQVAISDDVVSRDLKGEAVILNLESGSFATALDCDLCLGIAPDKEDWR